MAEVECLKIIGVSSNATGGSIDKSESHRLSFLRFMRKSEIREAVNNFSEFSFNAVVGKGIDG
jgi:hypothetical protein